MLNWLTWLILSLIAALAASVVFATFYLDPAADQEDMALTHRGDRDA